MEKFDEFLKRFSIRELKEDKPNGKTYWEGVEKGTYYRCTGLTGDVIMDNIRKAWTSTFARTYHDDNGKWWVGEKGSRKGFKTEEDARKHQARLIKFYCKK